VIENSPWPYPRWVAHRGAGKLAPENTLAAFRLGAAHGYRAFECDVKLSADGLPFLLHDATLERTTNGQGTAGSSAWDALSRLDAGSWHSRAYAGEPLPTLERLHAWLKANGFLVNLEIKPTPGTEEETGRVVASEVQRLWQSEAVPPLLSSFRPEALRAAQRAAPALPRALLLDSLWPGWEAVAHGLEVVAIVTNHKLMDAQLLAQARAAGWKALVYTVNEPEDAQRLLALPQGGIDGLITDAVDRFAPAA
jgi:glycerophosphoryl diester phosphodiesterase